MGDSAGTSPAAAATEAGRSRYAVRVTSRSAVLLATCLLGCVNGGIDDGAQSTDDARAPDAPTTSDARDSATPIDGAPALDAATTDTTPSSKDTAVTDTAPPADVGSCKTTCLGVECGPVPNGCGGILTCGDCGGAPGEYCVKVASPIFATAVHNAIEALAATSPAYLDVADVVGGNYRVLDNAAFRTALVAEMSKKPDLVCIGDPRDGTEIRVRPSTVDAAENYHVIISSGYTAYKYTSTCTPAGF
jgi:hypothetical protein